MASVTHNAASADALIEPPTPVQEPPPVEKANSDSNSKRKRFNKPNPSKRHGGAFYKKAKPANSLQIVTRRRHFPVFTSNLGCRTLTSACYKVIRCKDFRLTTNMSEHQLAYVTTVAWINRVVQCGVHYGYVFPDEASRLKQVSAGIQLPAVLASYIESVGEVTMSSGVTVVPHCSNNAITYLQEMMHSLDDDLVAAERDIPNNAWHIDVDWILEYNNSTTRAARSGMNFRTVDNSTLQGKVEMLVSSRAAGDLLLPEAPQGMTEAEAQLGAVYRFRDADVRDQWLGENTELLFNSHVAIPVDPNVLFSDLCVAAFKGMHVSTD